MAAGYIVEVPRKQFGDGLLSTIREFGDGRGYEVVYHQTRGKRRSPSPILLTRCRTIDERARRCLVAQYRPAMTAGPTPPKRCCPWSTRSSASSRTLGLRVSTRRVLGPRLEGTPVTLLDKGNEPFPRLPKPRPGDTVAILSPSAGLPAIFPAVYELGLERLRDRFGLVPKEFPTTRAMEASLEDRARDIMGAFEDSTCKAIISTTGGSDQIQLLRYLDIERLSRHPKPFFGYSDNTNLQLLLWSVGVRSFNGVSVMGQLAMQGGMHGYTEQYLRTALFENGEFEIVPSDRFTDHDHPWDDLTKLDEPRPLESNEGWYWDGAGQVMGRLWGGCYEILDWHLRIGRWIPEPEGLTDTILCVETSEELPAAVSVSRFFIALGERGWLDRFAAVLVGRPKAQSLEQPRSPADRAAFRADQREAIVRAVRQYSQIPLVMNMDFGHTDPHFPVPLGSMARIDSDAQKIWMDF